MSEIHYSSDEEEVFFGSKCESEALRRQRLFGENYNSPAAGCSTPRVTANYSLLKRPVILPDVLHSSNSLRQAPAISAESPTFLPSVDCSLNESNDNPIIIENSPNTQNNSVIVLSDDDSFIANEVFVLEQSFNKSVEKDDVKKSDKECKSPSPVSNETDFEVSELQDGRFLPNEDCVESSPVCSSVDPIIPQEQCDSEKAKDSGLKYNGVINDKVGSFTTAESGESSALMENINLSNEEKLDYDLASLNKKSLFCAGGISDLEYSLNGVSDSILDLTEVSSTLSPPAEKCTNLSGLQTDQYEDISCASEQYSKFDNSLNISKKHDTKDCDLHMSVDEIDFQQEMTPDTLANSESISQPLEINSCLSTSNSYYTAYNTSIGNQPPSEQSSSFQHYRDACDNSMVDEDLKISLKSDEGNKNEANFEIVMQARQNSFNGTSKSKLSDNTKETVKQKPVSRLPVYQSSTSLLRPAKLNLQTDALKTSGLNLAKTLLKSNSKTPSKLLKSESSKNVIPTIAVLKSTPSQKMVTTSATRGKTFTKTPAKVNTPMQHLSASQNKVQSSNLLYPTSPSHIPKAVKSDSKIKRAQTPLSNCKSAEKKNLTPFVLQNKNRFKNVISPIHAYINGSSPILQNKAQIVAEENFANNPNANTQYQTPPKKRTPLKVPRAVQRLDYENLHGQENINPNVISPSRNTLPNRILKPSVGVFWKQPEQPQTHLPKLGEKLTKVLLDTPRPKVIVHEGRVKESPKTKGVFVEATKNVLSTEQPGEVVYPSDQSEARISVRFQTTAQQNL